MVLVSGGRANEGNDPPKIRVPPSERTNLIAASRCVQNSLVVREASVASMIDGFSEPLNISSAAVEVVISLISALALIVSKSERYISSSHGCFSSERRVILGRWVSEGWVIVKLILSRLVLF